MERETGVLEDRVEPLTLERRRIEALERVREADSFRSLALAFKRVRNITEGQPDAEVDPALFDQAEEKDGVEYAFGADPKFAEAAEETALFAALDRAEAAIGPAMRAEDFAAAMTAMAALRAPIDAFFEAVQVNADNKVVHAQLVTEITDEPDYAAALAALG